MKKKVLIVNYREIYGGTIVLSALCKLLRERGVDARILYVHQFPDSNTDMSRYWHYWWRYSLKCHIKSVIYRLFRRFDFVHTSRFRLFEYCPVKGTKEKLLPFFSKKNTIVVYPEIVYGNFLQAANVVRWLLFHYRWANDVNVYNKDDLFICNREVFNDWNLNPNGNKVRIRHFDSDLYRQYNFGEREGKCYIVRKGAKRTDLPSSFDGPIIDKLEEAEIVEIFNRCKYCYSYDTQTFYVNIAAVCGCIPIIVPEPGKTIKDYRSEGERDAPGIAWGDSSDEINRAISTRDILLDRLDFTSSNSFAVDTFLQLVKQKFG